MKETLVANLSKLFAPTKDEHRSKLEIAVTEQIIDRWGDKLFPHGLTMIGPVTEIDGVIVQAKTRALQARYTLDMVVDVTPEFPAERLFEEISIALAQEIAYELQIEVDRLKTQGKVMVPYQLVIATPLVCRETFQPYMGFKVRYGELAR